MFDNPIRRRLPIRLAIKLSGTLVNNPASRDSDCSALIVCVS